MAAQRDPRIDALYSSDRRNAWLFVAALWISVLFVLYEVWPFFPDTGVRAVLVISALLVLVFNTASIGAMVKHYAEDKDFIYGLDLRHQDAGRRD
jgi:hypothetical protein